MLKKRSSIWLEKDCKYFKGDRPCKFHKLDESRCKCHHYEPLKRRILIIKLDAIGDVLRTTSILPPLASKYPNSHITWITRAEAVSVLLNNPLINRILVYGSESILVTQVEKFDLVINLDTGFESCALASIAQARKYLGFKWSPKGYPIPANQEALEWYEMGVDDILKRKNQKSYAKIICEIADLKTVETVPMLCLTDAELQFGAEYAQRQGIDRNHFIVGLNTGSGKRWVSKRWPQENLEQLIKKILDEKDWAILLLGGPEEEKLNQALEQKFRGRIYNSGSRNSIREFASLMNLAHVVVTADTLALHIAIALKKYVIALFGPTSASEIDLDGRGFKLTPATTCKCYYKSHCENAPPCMSTIEVQKVFNCLEQCEIKLGQSRIGQDAEFRSFGG